MKLIVGGNASGKFERVIELGYSKAEIYDCKLEEVPKGIEGKVLYKLNQLVDVLMKNGIEPIEYVNSLLDTLRPEIIVCDEIGCGVVPMNKYERELRDCVGRTCCMIAKRAKVVERIYCGVVTVIKTDED